MPGTHAAAWCFFMRNKGDIGRFKKKKNDVVSWVGGGGVKISQNTCHLDKLMLESPFNKHTGVK